MKKLIKVCTEITNFLLSASKSRNDSSLDSGLNSVDTIISMTNMTDFFSQIISIDNFDAV